MPTEPKPYSLEIIEIGNGRYRLDIPAASVEADDPEELLAHITRKAAEWEVAIAEAKEKLETIMMQYVEQNVARREVLKRLVKKCPPPQEWYDEPDWTDEMRES